VPSRTRRGGGQSAREISSAEHPGASELASAQAPAARAVAKLVPDRVSYLSWAPAPGTPSPGAKIALADAERNEKIDTLPCLSQDAVISAPGQLHGV